MIKYLYYRYWKYKMEFEKDHSVNPFAEYNMNSTIIKTKKKGDKTREIIRFQINKKKNYQDTIENIKSGGKILENDEYYAIRWELSIMYSILAVIYTGESGINFISARIVIPIIEGEFKIFLHIATYATAIFITAMGIISVHLLFKEISKNKPNIGTGNKKSLRVFWIIFWGFLLIITEYILFHLGMARIKDMQGNSGNKNIVIALVTLSMALPILGGGIQWKISEQIGAFINRRNLKKYSQNINKIENILELMKEQENSYFQTKVTKYWDRFMRLCTFKQYYNSKNKKETPPLSQEVIYAENYKGFYEEALKRYNKHKEN